MKVSLVLALLSATAFAQDTRSRLDALLSSRIEPNGPGAAVMIIQDGRAVYRKNIGLADLDSKRTIDDNTQFLWGSVTKQFTATAIMILENRGKLRLEDPLSKFSRSFPPMPTRSQSAIC